MAKKDFKCGRCGKKLVTKQDLRQHRCKKCRKEMDAEYNRKNPWASKLSLARDRCTNKNNWKYRRYGGRGIKCELTMSQIKHLWFICEAHKLKRPSIDRIDNNGSYTLGNCRFIELSENCSKGAK